MVCFIILFRSMVYCTCPEDTVLWFGETCKPINDAVLEATAFLQENMPSFDKANNETLFNGGIVIPTVNISLLARNTYIWAAKVPKDIFYDYVLPYASVNEARTNWRQLIWDKLTPEVNKYLLSIDANVNNLFELIARFVNSKMWKLLAPKNVDSIAFKSSQTPLIYDPMSTMMFGYASCTGISILYIDALRTLGIPARLVGTPAWNGNVTSGNHNWVEVWLGDDESAGWKFIEGMPAGGPGETFENPCDKWFCDNAHFNGYNTKVFAARFNHSEVYYPMAWDLKNVDIPGEDRSEYYQTHCENCSSNGPLIEIII